MPFFIFLFSMWMNDRDAIQYDSRKVLASEAQIGSLSKPSLVSLYPEFVSLFMMKEESRK